MSQVGFLRVAQVAHQRAAGPHRQRALLEAEAVQALRPELLEQARPGGLRLESPRIDRRRRNAERGDGRQERRQRELGRDDQLARAQHRHLVGQRLQAGIPRVLRREELAGREVDEGDADGLEGSFVLCAGGSAGGQFGCDRHQERGLPGVEIGGVGQRSRRHDAHDFAPHQPLGLLRVLDLLADGDPEPLLHQLRQVAVHGVIGHAAHRDAAAARVLAARGQRQLQRPRGHESVLVEHLVEVAHPEEDDGVAVLALRLEVLPHGRRGLGGGDGQSVIGGGRHESQVGDSLQ